ncbi:2-oxo-4-hydroxy-4-carboxy-5-ureidoimidazoline decarboxylase [Geodermatophilus sp. TF02-6]|uniref:2-oxo-4-hydroxy-4-carboxy-5-ureidoimidazoline decarboxylase n=1 Tax=Geodermatophilus sp. TF02-6 TaxID=2250575 RepID=UPI000DEB7324|nr:2-oxo-4-hydroxy-4-carboxy-5-ureidoimidazoline decarboxylase [Geodermatophilus sp. TF02-6]RBY76821.1 2-oxo-4-hydroxy-4-carboxy-5-ureidoimidazoline decarboxylase [Geodermatophilus sp. TF02-6]
MEAQPVSDAALDRFNTSPADTARQALSVCCASTTWVSRLAAGRPYRSREALLDTAELACRELSDADLEEALSAHPRIGDRASGGSTEARWSRQEQASVSDSDDRTRAELRAANLAYEERFGRVFLIRAAGRSPVEMLAEARRRLRNDPATERREVGEQLGQIARLRVEKLLET